MDWARPAPLTAASPLTWPLSSATSLPPAAASAVLVVAFWKAARTCCFEREEGSGWEGAWLLRDGSGGARWDGSGGSGGSSGKQHTAAAAALLARPLPLPLPSCALHLCSRPPKEERDRSMMRFKH